MNTAAGHGLMGSTLPFPMVVRVLMLLAQEAPSLWKFGDICFESDRDDGIVFPGLSLC